MRMSEASRIDRLVATMTDTATFGESIRSRATAAELEHTFEETYQLHANSLLAFLINRLRNLHDAEEVSQQAWLQVHRAWPPARTDHLRAWLFNIARHAAVDFLRRRSKGGIDTISLDIESQSDPMDSRAAAPLESVLANEDLERRHSALQSCIAMLPEEEKIVFIARQKGKSYKTLRAEFDIEQNRAYGLLHAAVERLKECVKRHFQ